MNNKIYIVAVVVICIFWLYRPNLLDDDSEQYLQVSTGVSGFTEIPEGVTVEGSDRVIIYAGMHCSAADTRKADKLEQELKEQNIPYYRTNRVSFSGETRPIRAVEDEKALEREWNEKSEKINLLLDQPKPLVFVNGKVKSDPRLLDVIVEYKKTH